MAEDTPSPAPRRPRKPRSAPSPKPETISGSPASGAAARKADAIVFEPKQAVVLVHGMGEQRPLETLRGFVDAVYTRDTAFGTVPNPISVVPDETTGSAELRRITTHSSEGRRTDFYEFYWADIMDGTPVEQVASWFQGLLLRSPLRLPARIQVWLAWLVLWAVTLVFILLGLVVVFPQVFSGPLGVDTYISFFLTIRWWLGLALIIGGALMLASDLWSRRPAREINFWFFGLITIGLLLMFLPRNLFDEPGTLAPILLVIVAWAMVAVPYFGDVVRYVRATPKTVERRAAVRDRGLALLNRLHDRKGPAGEPYYSRIVVVAHSLGAIIAYDLLQHLWQQRGAVHTNEWDPKGADAAMLAIDAFVEATWSPDAPQGMEPQVDLPAYQRSQQALFEALRASALNWRVSDLITLGSPLVHAEFLMFDSKHDLDAAFVERSAASSPPRPAPVGTNPSRTDTNRPSMLYDEIQPDGSVRGPYAHFAAPFAAVRWTNIFDEHWFPALGDLISGPARCDFGPGIAEHRVAIKRPHWWPLANRFFTHTRYWAWDDSFDATNPPDHIRLLRGAINLAGEVAPRTP